MPRVQRSPPSASSSKVPQTQSEPDLTQAVSDQSHGSDAVKVLPRNKRPRSELSPEKCDLANFKRELTSNIMDILQKWQETHDNNLMSIIENQNTILNTLASEVNEIKMQNKDILKSYHEIEKSINFVNQQYEELKSKISCLEKERLQLLDHNKSLENKLKDIRLGSRCSSIEIRNVPPKEKESYTDLISVISNIGEAVKVNISTSDIRDIRRLPGKSGAARTIVAEFTQIQTKSHYLSQVREYNKKLAKSEKLNTTHIGIQGEKHPIFVSEYLPPTLKKLLFQAREFANKNSYLYSWTANGNIFIRKEDGASQILIKSEQCLIDLQKKN